MYFSQSEESTQNGWIFGWAIFLCFMGNRNERKSKRARLERERENGRKSWLERVNG